MSDQPENDPKVSLDEPAPEAPTAPDTDAAPAYAPSGETDALLDALRAENADLKDKLLRSFAEMENVRRRTEREKSDTAKFAISEFARDVIGIGDNVRRAIESVPKEAAAIDPALKTLLEGVEVTERELFNVLERHGIKRFDPKGEKFDPHIHDAMMRIEKPDAAPDTVVQVIHAGYMIADRILRPAAVIVAKAGSGLSADGGEPAAKIGEAPEGGTDGAADEPVRLPDELPGEGENSGDGANAASQFTNSKIQRRGPGYETVAAYSGHKAQVIRPVNVSQSVLSAKRQQSSMTKPVINHGAASKRGNGGSKPGAYDEE